MISQDDFVKGQIEKRLVEIKADDRLEGPTATVFENAPLALMQLKLETMAQTLQWVLRLMEAK